MSHLSLQDLRVPLEDHVQWLESMILMLRAPESTLVANAGLASLTINAHFLVMGGAFLLLVRRNHNLFLDSMKAVQHLYGIIMQGLRTRSIGNVRSPDAACKRYVSMALAGHILRTPMHSLLSKLDQTSIYTRLSLHA